MFRKLSAKPLQKFRIRFKIGIVKYLFFSVYIRVLHFYQNKDDLQGIDYFFDYYYRHLAEYYGPKSELCSIHIHLHQIPLVD